MNKVFWLVSVDRSKKDSVNWSQSSQNIMHWKEAGIQWLEVCILGCRDSRCDGSERHVSVVCLCEWMRGRSSGKQGQIVEDLICHGKKSDDKSFKDYQQEVWAGSSVRECGSLVFQTRKWTPCSGSEVWWETERQCGKGGVLNSIPRPGSFHQ